MPLDLASLLRKERPGGVIMRVVGWIVALIGAAFVVVSILIFRNPDELGIGPMFAIFWGPLGLLAFLAGLLTVYVSHRQPASTDADSRQESESDWPGPPPRN